MSKLQTSAESIYRWIGADPIRRSDNLKLPDPVKARLARIYWSVFQEVVPAAETGGDDAA